MDHAPGTVESLGAFLARVRPGDRCTCCGAVLQPLDRGPRLRGSTSGGGEAPGDAGRTVAGVQAVTCPDCGCEISEEPGADIDEGLGELSTAA